MELQSLSRRGLVRFESNPFLPATSENTNEGTKRKALRSKDGSQMMVMSQDGSYTAPAGFWHTQEVDKTQFVKLYVNGVKAFSQMSSSGARVFELIYNALQKSIGKDIIYISFSEIDQTVSPMPKTTFLRGMKEVCVKGFLAESKTQNKYFVNPDFIFNGDRLAIVKEYRIKRDEASDVKYRDQLEARGQERLLP
jgi:dipeptidyl aminopeptidase/acylaminoacyl peptidase